jgi:hypothetical protein
LLTNREEVCVDSRAVRVLAKLFGRVSQVATFAKEGSSVSGEVAVIALLFSTII